MTGKSVIKSCWVQILFLVCVYRCLELLVSFLKFFVGSLRRRAKILLFGGPVGRFTYYRSLEFSGVFRGFLPILDYFTYISLALGQI